DHFTFLQEYAGKKFMDVVEILGGTRLLTVEERREIEERREKWEQAEKDRIQRTRSAVETIFAEAAPIAGTHAAAYLEARGMRVSKNWTFDLRFTANLKYRGYPGGDADQEVDLGAFPAMVAAIRNTSGAIIGLHRTYLDKSEPKKLSPPGDQKRNRAKKIMGEQRGGLIYLSPPAPILAMGEGIETTRSWSALGLIDADIAIAAAVSLGNLSGGSLGTERHPKDASKRIPNGLPDMDHPGVVLPEVVREVIELGDGDSDPFMTRARLLVAARRFRKQGRTVSVSMAPAGMDFNDVLMAGDQ
ncbi:hypothetical protein BO068_004767, partial [Escherichia coli]|nr:hypothetical protein [Escherichia coli]